MVSLLHPRQIPGSVHPVLPSFHLSFRPSFRLPMYFLGNVILVFSKFWLGARNPCEVVYNRAGFSGKKKIYLPPPSLPKKKLENGPKMGKKQFFLIQRKIWSLIFTEFVL